MKNLKMNIRISDEQDFLLRELGGHTPGFEKMFNFYLENYDTSEEFEKEEKRKNTLDRIRLNKEYLWI